MTDETVTQAEYAPCPTCRQYSHSIGEDALSEAFLHFETMIAHPVRGHPMGQAFDDKTRDMAQRLMAAARQSERRDDVGRLREAIDAIHPNSSDEEWTRLLSEAMNAADEIASLHDIDKQAPPLSRKEASDDN